MNVVRLACGRVGAGQAVGRASTIGFQSITPKPFDIFEQYLVGLYNRSAQSVMYKNDNSACLQF